ncbi:hypothetical protein PGB90_001523 [Kerria lacca]
MGFGESIKTPLWLLASGKRKGALKSFHWLRGWVTIDEIKKEFCIFKKYMKESKYSRKNWNTYNSVPTRNSGKL